MARINEIKEQQIVVRSVGQFAGSLQQIAAARMTKLRKLVLSSRRFVEEATIILRELQLERDKAIQQELKKKQGSGKKSKDKKKPTPKKQREAIIVVSSDQGLCGSYNTEITKKIEEIYKEYVQADWFVIGSKGQEFFAKFAKRHELQYYPYNIPEEVTITDLKPLIGMFFYYDHIYLMYSKYINTAKREVVLLELAIPNIAEVEELKEEEEGKFIFEPDIDQLIKSLSSKLRYALFKQQILDSKLSLYSAQMMAMKTASDNSEDLLKDLQLEYNKARRKQIDKKIQEVQAGRALWADDD